MNFVINHTKTSLRLCNKNIKCIIIVILSWAASANMMAQQDALYTQYMFSTLSYNPAYAGSRDALSIMALSRHQWIGFEGAPSTQSLTAHSPVGKNIGLGLSIIHDKLDPTTQTGFYFDYSYTLRFDNSKLSMGIKAGFNLFNNDILSLSIGNNLLTDPLLNSTSVSKLLPNFGFGLYYYSDNFYFGASSPKLLENKLSSGDIEVFGTTGKEIRHYFVTGGYVFKISSEVKFKPSILARITQAAPVSLDMNLNFLFKDKLWIGSFYRLKSSLGGIFQYQLNQQLKIGYAFDMMTNELSHYNSGTHEIMILYDFIFTKDKIQHPRYF